MKKLFAAVPVLALLGASFSASCGNSGDQGTGTGNAPGNGTSGSANPGSGGAPAAAGSPSIGGSPTGTSGSPNGTAGTPTGTGGTPAGSGGGGPTAAGGAPPVGTGGAPPTGTGGSSTAGSSNTAGSGPADLLQVASVLNGQMLTGLCLRDTQASVCATINGACPPANTADRALSGVITTDKNNLRLGGTMGQPYTITLHVQGEVESKQYPGGVDQNSSAQSPRADGFIVGGTPTTADAYNVYMIRVTNPGATTKTDYFLNSLQAPGVSNHTNYGIDYTAQIKAQGGATIRLVAADSNCSMIKNCGDMPNDGNTCMGPIIPANIEPQAIALNPGFSFTAPYNGQFLVLTVKNVTSP